MSADAPPAGAPPVRPASGPTSIVIGGGVAGLAAAYELVQAGHAVRLLEASPALGGQVRTFEAAGAGNAGGGNDGGRLEAFYHHLFRSDHEVISLIEELGLGEDLQWIDSRVAMLAGGRIYAFNGALDLLRFDAVSLPTRVRLGLAALWLRRQRRWRGYEGQRAAEWIRRRVGREGYERVWAPLLRAKFGRHAEEVSLAWFWGKLHLRFASRGSGPLAREQLGYLRGSFGRLVDALAAAIVEQGGVIETGHPVQRVLIEGDPDGTRHVRGVAVATSDGAGGGVDGGGVEEIPAETVIATVPSMTFARLAPELEPAYAEMLEAVTYQWATVLVLALDRPLSAHYWLTITDADCPFVVAVEHTNFASPAEYGGRHLLYLSNYVDAGDPLVGEDADAVLTRYAPYLRRINPAFERSWVLERWWFTDRAGQPVVHARYHETIPPYETGIAGLYLANTTQIYPQDRGQNYSIRLGRRVARQAAARSPLPARPRTVEEDTVEGGAR